MFDQLHSGELYYPMDDTVLHEQLQYLELLYDYNQTRPLEQERRAALLRRMFAEIGEGELSAKIEVSEMLGSEYNIHARSGEDEVVMVVPTVGLGADVSMGQDVKFTTQPGLLQLFDKESGNNLIWYDPESAEANAPECMKY